MLAFAARDLGAALLADREDAERDLCFLGLAAMLDPPRPEVADAVARCHTAGIRVIVVTGDHPLTATAIAAQLGIGSQDSPVITGTELDQMTERDLDELLRSGQELIFARASPEAKLRIADALRAQHHTVAMTGDGVNDAPALRRAGIGIAIGRSGTDVAREASTMVLTDDNFATIVVAVQEGRRVYDNIRKFLLYIFAHTTPEVAPFLVFALARGAERAVLATRPHVRPLLLAIQRCPAYRVAVVNRRHAWLFSIGGSQALLVILADPALTAGRAGQISIGDRNYCGHDFKAD